MDGEQKPDLLLLLKPPTQTHNHKVACLENNPTLSYRDFMNKRAASRTAPRISWMKAHSSAQLPQNQLVFIKDEPRQRPSELPSLTPAAADWIGTSNNTHTHSPSDKEKLMLTFSSANSNLHNKAPPQRPNAPQNPTQHIPSSQHRVSTPNSNLHKKSPPLRPNAPEIPTRLRSGLKRKAPPPPIDPNSTRNGGKSAENLMCQLCQVSCSSALTMQQHLNGRPHKAKMEYVKMKRDSTTTKKAPRCEVCEIWCSDVAALEMHFKGQKHKSNLVCRQRGGGGVSKAPIMCQLCNVPCMNQDLYEMHLRGRQHATIEELKRRGML